MKVQEQARLPMHHPNYDQSHKHAICRTTQNDHLWHKKYLLFVSVKSNFIDVVLGSRIRNTTGIVLQKQSGLTTRIEV